MLAPKTITHCPNDACQHHTPNRTAATPIRFYRYKGSFTTQHNLLQVTRYQCKCCKKKFSDSTFSPTYRQKKPYLNPMVFQLYLSGTTQRRLAQHLKTSPSTVAAKFRFLAQLAREVHNTRVKSGSFSAKQIHFDEMQSFEHTRLKPLSIALAVSGSKNPDGTPGPIVDIQVAQLSYRGKLANLAQKKYGIRADESGKARKAVLETVREVASREGLKITTDAKAVYRPEIRNALAGKSWPFAIAFKHEAVPNRKNQTLHADRPTLKKRKYDPMFWLNHVAARIRHDLSRMQRKVWTTTKHRFFLQAHLDLFIAFYNRYDLGV